MAASPATCILDKAVEEYTTKRNWVACLALLRSLHDDKVQASEINRHVRQLQALCNIQRAAASNTWDKLIGIDKESATTADISRQYKRLCVLVHPDKCLFIGQDGQCVAEEAFKKLTNGIEKLKKDVELASKRSNKRQRVDEGDGYHERNKGHEESDDIDVDIDDNSCEDDFFGSSFPWWEEWEDSNTQTNEKDKETAINNSQKEEAADLLALCSLDIEQLKNEVRKRQNALLEGPLDEQGNRIPMQTLKQRLQRARDELNKRLQVEKSSSNERNVAQYGGFLLKQKSF